MRVDILEHAKPDGDATSELPCVVPGALDPGGLAPDHQEREGSGAKRLAPERLISQELSRKRLRRRGCPVNLKGEHITDVGPADTKQRVGDHALPKKTEQFHVALPPLDDRRLGLECRRERHPQRIHREKVLQPPVEPAGRRPRLAMRIGMAEEPGPAERERVDVRRLETRTPAPKAPRIKESSEAFTGGPLGPPKQQAGKLRCGDISHPASRFQDLDIAWRQPERSALPSRLGSASTPHHLARPMAVGFHTAWLHRGQGTYMGVRPHPGVGHGAKALPRNVLPQ